MLFSKLRFNSFSEYFKSEFYKKLLKPGHPLNPVRNRADSMLIVFSELEKRGLDRYFIVETGTTRSDHGKLAFGDDGASIYIFDKFINFYDGEVYSVDIEQKNVTYSQSLVSNKTRVFCQDSVSFLWQLPKDRKIDLLYLDSFDIVKENPHPSQLHHLKELCSAMDKLGEGSIIVVDDHDAFFTGGRIGKATYVKEYMESIGAKKLFEGYQIGWIL